MNKLYFIRDVCRPLEDEITIAFKKKDIREVMKQVSKIKETKLAIRSAGGVLCRREVGRIGDATRPVL